MFVKDEAKISTTSGRCQVKELRILASCFFESDEQEFSLRGFKSKKISSNPRRYVEERFEGEKCLSRS